MKRTRIVRRYVVTSESEDERPLKKNSSLTDEITNNTKHQQESSSESDIEEYLLKPEKLNLDSQFFSTNLTEFEKVEENILFGVTKLNDTESETDEEKHHIKVQKEKMLPTVQLHDQTSSKMDFKQLQDYATKIEEAKKYVEIYKAKKEAEENNTDIRNLLAAGEGKSSMAQTLKPADLHSSDFESHDSDEEDWQEIKSKAIQENQESFLPQKGLQITVDMPDNVKKKKGVDLLAAMKRRLNRIRKENQILVHKVHLLCWLAHGNYVNSSVNNTETLAMALSLLPSEQCYPSNRVNLSYLEQIVNWYKRTVKNIEKPVPKSISLDKCLQLQISKKEAYNKHMLVFIFIAILRALGIQCRIVMSLQVEPLRPPVSDLHTVSTKSSENKDNKQSSVKQKHVTVRSTQSKTQCSLKHKTDTVTPNKTFVNKELETRSVSKLKSVKNAATKSGFNNEHKECKAGSSKDVHYVVENKVMKAGTNKINNNAIKDRNKLPEIKIDRRKSTRSKPLPGENKNVLTAVKYEEFINSKDNKIKRAENYTKSKIDINLKLSEENTKIKKKYSKKIEQNYEIQLKPKKDFKKIESAANNCSVKGNNRKQQTAKETSKSTLQNRKKIELNSSTLETERPTGSTENKNSVASDKGRSNSIKSRNSNRKVQTITKKNIPQVDGIDDSDSGVETVISQLDGANDTKKRSKDNIPSNVKPVKKSSSSRRVKAKSKRAETTDSESEFEPVSGSPINKKRLCIPLESCNLKKLKKKQLSSTAKKLDVRNDIMNLIKDRIIEQKEVDRSRLAKKGKRDLQSDSDSDYVPQTIKKKYHDSEDDFVPKTKVKRRVQVIRKSVLSESDNDGEKNKKAGNDVWLEVFLEAEEKWISVDVVYGQIHCVKEIYQRATHPVSYVVSWDNNNRVKDVTQRYCQNFNTVTRKYRVDPKSWNVSLKPFMGTQTAKDREEDDDLARQQLDQPLPKAISEYKNHPLYALKRHLLKFEAIYPPEPPTLGFIRGEAVYPRSCIYTLHSRDIWLKQAKVVKLGEHPYKIVKARPKYDRLSNKVITTDQTLEIYGPWQVQDYEPPTAENGIVPKNAFGNVDLFKSCMLPKGCVHLKLPGLNKIARKMNIDIASAIVGFDFHGGWSHPVYDGFVVCKEYEDQLISAWELEQDELEKKEEEKIDKRVYGNWKKLIKGLLIRERLKAKYDFGEPSTSNVKEKKKRLSVSTR